MGGRGASSGRTGGNTATTPTSPTWQTDPQTGVRYIEEPKHGLHVAERMVNELGMSRAMNEAKNVTDALDLFGFSKDEAQAAVSIIGLEDDDYNVYAFHRAGEIMANPVRFLNANDLKQAYQGTVDRKYHPQGTTADDILAHEAGHAIGRYIAHGLYDMQTNGGFDWDLNYKYLVKGKAENDIVSEALRAVKKTEYGKGKKNDELVEALSGYSIRHKRSKGNQKETFAEAVADYRRNGKNANPLSVEIMNIARKRLDDVRQYRKSIGVV